MCISESDHHLGLRVDTRCRGLDFTLSFEDAVFHLIPPVLFLLLFPIRLFVSRKSSRKLLSRHLSIVKSLAIAILLMLQLAWVILRTRYEALSTPMALPADITTLIAIAVAMFVSYWEDQHTIQPSIILVLFWSALAVLGIPRLRTLWLMGNISPLPILWTLIFVASIIVLAIEMVRKTHYLAERYREATSEERSDVWSWALFVWLLPFLRVGFSQILTLRHLPPIDPPLQATMALKRLRSQWKALSATNKGTYSHIMLRATFKAYLVPFLTALIPRLCLSGFTFCQPFLITASVTYFEEDESADTIRIGRALVGAYALVYLGIAISTAIYWRQTFRFITMVRGGLIAILHEKTTETKEVQLQDRAALTLMGTDVERIITAFRSIHELWASPIEIAIAVYLLQRQVGAACVVPGIVAIVCLLAMMRVSSRSRYSQKRWVERVEKRLELTSIMLSKMKAVKMLGITKLLQKLVDSLREVELRTSKQFRKLLIWQIFLSNAPIDFAPMATFLVFSIIAIVKSDNTLLSAQAFTALSLISLLTTPLLTFIQAVPNVYQCIGCFERIEHFCSMDHNDQSGYDFSPPSFVTESQLNAISEKSQSNLVQWESADIRWKMDLEPVLHDISLRLPRSKITMVVGPVSSGKSTLIASMLEETIVSSGSMFRNFPQAAYCSQPPWMVNASVQMNVTNSPGAIDEKWYAFSIWACALEDDIASLPGKDSFKVGSDGVALSGGQKQRIALARAVYSKQPIVVLDDVASGLDARSITLISARLFGRDGYFRENAITVVLATHSRQLLRQADDVVILNSGRVGFHGPYSEIPSDLELGIESNPDEVSESQVSISSFETSDHANTPAGDAYISEYDTPEIDTVENDWSRRDGSWSVYSYYCKAAGYVVCVLFGIFIAMTAFTTNFPALWIEWWSAANAEHPNQQIGMYLGVYAFISVAAVVTLVLASWALLINIVTNTALALHADLLKSTVQAPFSFLRSIDTGRLTNRFSQDMDLIDMKLPIIAINTFSEAGNCLAKVIILCAVAKYLGIIVPPLFATVFAIQRCYLRTSRQVRLLDIESRSPLFTHFLETIQGASTIRAFGWQTQFQERGKYLLNESQRPVYALYCIQQWLTVVLDLLIGAVAVIVVATTTSLRDQFTGGSVGVALNMVLTFSQSLNALIKFWTQLETSIGAVTRVEQFVRETPSEERDVSPISLEPGWPVYGAVEIENVTVQLGDDDPPVLADISISIKAGEKIAICGPSGSGKTSLVLALLQMMDLQNGRIQIDGQDLANLQPHDVTSRLNVIPQDSFIMPSTLRLNLDPSQTASDETIETALQAVGLWETVTAIGGLDIVISVAAWSVGELQLLSLARAMAKNSSILILDEAMSSVDHETEATMQDIIDQHFSTQTVLAVVHRLAYIHRFDRVLVLKKGRVLEFDSPETLLARDSELRRLYAVYR